MGAPLAAMRNQFLAVAGAAAALGTALSAMAMRGASDIDKAAKAARRIGGTVAGYRALEMAADDAGVSLSGLANDIQTMNRELTRAEAGKGKAADALKKLGLSAADFAGLDADERVAKLADRVRELGLDTGQTTLLLRDLGIRNREMALLVMGGGEALRNARRDVNEFGLAISDIDAARIEAANDEIAGLADITAYLGDRLALKLVPALGNMAKAMTDSLREGGLLRAMIDGLVDNLQRLSAYIAVVVTGFGVRYVAALVAARLATISLAGSLALLRTAIMRTGIGVLIIAAGELLLWFGRLVSAAGSFRESLRRVYDVGKAVFLGIGNTAWGLLEILGGVASGIAASFTSAFVLIARAWDGLINGMATAWNAIAGTAFGEAIGLGAMGESNAAGDIQRFADTLYDQAVASITRGGKRIKDAGAAVAEAAARAVTPVGGTSGDLPETPALLDDIPDAPGGGGSGGGKGGGGKSSAAKAADEAREALAKLRQEHRDLQATIGMTAAQERVYNAVQELGAKATADQVAEVQRLVPAIDALKAAKDRMAQAAQNGQRSIESLLDSLMDRSKSAKGVVLDLLAQIARVQAMNAIFQLPGMGGFASTLGSWLTPQVPAFANGGSHAGGIRLVGERGPEIEATGPARYFSAAQTRSMLGGGGQGNGAQSMRVAISFDDVGGIRAVVRNEAGAVVAEARQSIISDAIGGSGRAMGKTKKFGNRG